MNGFNKERTTISGKNDIKSVKAMEIHRYLSGYIAHVNETDDVAGVIVYIFSHLINRIEQLEEKCVNLNSGS